MPRRIRDVKLRNSRPTRQQRLDREDKQVCPECGYDGCFDIYEIIGGCEGEVTKIHCSNCGGTMSDSYISRTCTKCRNYEEWYDEPPDTCTYCKRFYQDLFEKKGAEEP